MPAEAASQADVWARVYSSFPDLFEWPAVGHMSIGIFVGFWVGIFLPGDGGAAQHGPTPILQCSRPVSGLLCVFLLGMASVTAIGRYHSVLCARRRHLLTAFPCTRVKQVVHWESKADETRSWAPMSKYWSQVICDFQSDRLSCPPEFFMMAVLGLSFLCITKWWLHYHGPAHGGIGLILATVGQGIRAMARLRLYVCEPYLFNGLDIVPAAVGLFAVPASIVEMIKNLEDGYCIGCSRARLLDSIRGIKDNLLFISVTIRASSIVFGAGTIPGVGG